VNVTGRPSDLVLVWANTPYDPAIVRVTTATTEASRSMSDLVWRAQCFVLP
jgi:hypothetical protein